MKHRHHLDFLPHNGPFPLGWGKGREWYPLYYQLTSSWRVRGTHPFHLGPAVTVIMQHQGFPLLSHVDEDNHVDIAKSLELSVSASLSCMKRLLRNENSLMWKSTDMRPETPTLV